MEEDWGKDIHVGCTGDEPWEEMHRAGERYLHFTVRFAKHMLHGEAWDCRQELERVWAEVITGLGLSAAILRQAPKPNGQATGFVWRQFGREAFGSITDEEIEALKASLMGAGEGIVRFSLFEFITGEVRGAFERRKKHVFENGTCSEVELA